ncbi:choice-of-anchor Q domain-containing protein [Clostridium vincentii]|uniref:Uncharacterized protein n=1 Tax=Clostridium vincentii TaxID=52704 RepID=A0A2T0B4W8_9CLOT|nr:choice-of-anchor Q domain-containing protein [Clostridium vincentii]PRR78853.1 hypothetical protein CLVI_34400 [Clostridium vincentii]
MYNGTINDGKNNNTNKAEDPKFIDAANYNFKLAEDSPAIDKGVSALDNGSIPDKDINGILRPQGNGIDMGALESGVNTPDPIVPSR